MLVAAGGILLLIHTSDDSSSGTLSNKGQSIPAPTGAWVAKTLDDFAGVDDSEVYPRGAGTEIKNITDEGNGLFKFVLRHRGSWYDGDRDLKWNYKGHDKSRAECAWMPKNKSQVEGETWEYGTTVQVDKDFSPSRGYCNLMQLFPMAWVQLTKISGDVITGGLVHTKAWDAFHPNATVRQFTFRRGEWISLAVRLKIHATNGECMLSVNGDEYQGARGVRMITVDKEYGGKWGIYGSATKDVNGKPLGDWTVWHKNIWSRKIS
jgi:hypothetical protein